MSKVYNILREWDRLHAPNPYWRVCPLCNGTGLNPKLLTYVCPKCQGEKKVPR